MQEQFLLAAFNNDLTKLQSLLSEDASLIHSKDLYNRTALLIAAGRGHFEIVKLLVEKEPSLMTDKDKNGDTALLQATLNGHLEVVQYLLSKDHFSLRNLHNKLLLNACISENLKVIEFIFESGRACIEDITNSILIPDHKEKVEKVKQIPKIKNTLELYVSLRNYAYQKANKLLKQDVYVNFIDAERNTLLHRVALDTSNPFREEMLKLLIQKGANRYCKNDAALYPVRFIKEDSLRLLLIPDSVQLLELLFPVDLESLICKIAENTYFPKKDLTVYNHNGDKSYLFPREYVSHLLFNEIKILLTHHENGNIQWEPERSSFYKNFIALHEKKSALSKDFMTEVYNYELTKVESNNLETLISNLQSFNQHLCQKKDDSEIDTKEAYIRITEKMIETYSLKEITFSSDENLQLTSSARLFKRSKQSVEEETSLNTNTKKLKTDKSSSSRHGSQDPVHRDVKA